MSRSFGDIVKRRRSALGMTQARLADLVGRSISTVRAWERDRTHPSDEETLSAVVAVLGITPAELVEADMVFPGGIPATEKFSLKTQTVPAPDPDAKPIGHDEPEPAPVDATPERDDLAGGESSESSDGDEGSLLARQSGAPLHADVGLEKAPPDVESVPAVSEQGSVAPADDPIESSPGAAQPADEVVPPLGSGSVESPGGVTRLIGTGSSGEAGPRRPEPSDHVMPSDEVDLEARTSLFEDGGVRVLGVGTSADALRPDPFESPEPEPEIEPEPEPEVPEELAAPEDEEPAPWIDAEPGGEVAPASAGEPVDDDDPFAPTEVVARPVSFTSGPRRAAAALREAAESTRAVGLRPVPVRADEPAPVYENYLDDPDEERRYRVRAVLTVVGVIFLFIFLRWALGGMGEAIGQLWSNFRGSLKI